jgi:hypothetical protein
MGPGIFQALVGQPRPPPPGNSGPWHALSGGRPPAPRRARYRPTQGPSTKPIKSHRLALPARDRSPREGRAQTFPEIQPDGTIDPSPTLGSGPNGPLQTPHHQETGRPRKGRPRKKRGALTLKKFWVLLCHMGTILYDRFGTLQPRAFLNFRCMNNVS